MLNLKAQYRSLDPHGLSPFTPTYNTSLFSSTSDVQSGEAGEAESHLSYSNVTEKQLKIVIIIKCLH